MTADDESTVESAKPTWYLSPRVLAVAFFATTAVLSLTLLLVVLSVFSTNSGCAELSASGTGAQMTWSSEQSNVNMSLGPARVERSHCVLGHSSEDWIAIFTELLVAGTIALALFTSLLWLDTKNALADERHLALANAKASRKAFAFLHRPRLRIRLIEKIDLLSDKLTATINVSNVGDTDATLIEVGTAFFTRNPWQAAPFRPSQQPIVHEVLVPGENTRLATDKPPLDHAELLGVENGSLQLCLYGIIAYLDANSVRRNTGLLRVYDRASRGFVRVPGSDPMSELEFED